SRTATAAASSTTITTLPAPEESTLSVSASLIQRMKRSQRLSEPSMSYESMRSVRSLRASSSFGVQPVDLIDTVPEVAVGPEVAVVHMGLDMLRSVESGRAADSVASRHCGAQEAQGWSHQRN